MQDIKFFGLIIIKTVSESESQNAVYAGPGEINIVSGTGSQEFSCSVCSPSGPEESWPCTNSQQRSISSWTASTHQLQPLNNNPPGSAENLGMAMDMADWSRRATVRQKKSKDARFKLKMSPSRRLFGMNKWEILQDLASISHICLFGNFKRWHWKINEVFYYFPASAGPPLELIKLSIIKCPLTVDGIYVAV